MKKENLELAVALRRELHAHPELSGQEVWTKRRLMAFLEANTRLEIIDRGHWFYAAYRAGRGGPSIAFRADFDAVPVRETCDIPWKSKSDGIAHKCGHDGHSAALAAFALEIDQSGADKNIFFLFQHAEETGEGALECRALIGEENIREIFGYHNITGVEPYSVWLKDGAAHCASKGMSIYLKGAPSHAGEPERGRNPAFAVAELALSVPELIGPERWKDMVMCTIVHMQVGEAAFGVSPGEGLIRMTCRAVREAEMDALCDELETLARSLAEKYGLTPAFEYCESFPETVNHAKSADKVRRAAAELGYHCFDAASPMRASEDFGHYTKLIPGAMFWVGNPAEPSLHSQDYDYPDSQIERVVEIYKKLAEYPL